MYPILEHPDITRCLRTGYPDRGYEEETEEYDEDALYEEQREAAYGME